MDPFFKQLGDSVLERWKRDNFSLEKFPKIACAALEKQPPAEHVDLPAIMRDFLFSEDQPAQTDSPFGEPELVVYKHPRFYIQLLFWLEGTTAIHQHEFSGAFHVMHGSSIHAQYAFDEAHAVTPYLRVGDVRMKTIELLETGRTVPIISGRGNIHSLFHLDSPSATVVVRTQHDPGTGPQLNYLPPHIAIDPHHNDLLTMRRKQLLDVLEQVQDDSYAQVVRDMLADLDFERGFFILQPAMPYLQSIDEWKPTIKAFEKKHGRLAAGVSRSLEEETRRDRIKDLRGLIVEPEHRFFLALLMNCPTRADLLTLVKKRYPKQKPTLVILRWVEEMMEISANGVSILDIEFPASVDVDADSQPQLFLESFGFFMAGSRQLPPVLKRVSSNNIKQLRAAFADSALRLLLA